MNWDHAMATEGDQADDLVLCLSGIPGTQAIEIQMSCCFFSVFDPSLRLKGPI